MVLKLSNVVDSASLTNLQISTMAERFVNFFIILIAYAHSAEEIGTNFFSFLSIVKRDERVLSS